MVGISVDHAELCGIIKSVAKHLRDNHLVVGLSQEEWELVFHKYFKRKPINKSDPAWDAILSPECLDKIGKMIHQ